MATPGIRILDEHVANKIAAGEVIERPASVVKELVENALDAGATRVEVEIKAGGKEYIRVTDNGQGIAADQLPLAFERHATSKISVADDLFNVTTLGFRGEALPSIAAVAEVEVRSRTKNASAGVAFSIKAGEGETLEPVGTPIGTTVVVRRLFFNTPARYKFLRTDGAERRRVADVIARIALAWPEVAFRFVADGQQLFATAGDGQLLTAIGEIYGREVLRDLVSVALEQNGLHVKGYVSKPDKLFGNRDRMSVFLNKRWIQSSSILHAIQRGYETLLPPRRFPLAVLRLTVDAAAVDVNVHPAKAEVRFQDDGAVYRTVMRAVRHGLLGANLVGRFKESLRPSSPGSQVRDGQTKQKSVSFLQQTDVSFPQRKDVSFAKETLQTRLPSSYANRESQSFELPKETSDPKEDVGPATSADDLHARTELKEMVIIGQLQQTFILGETRSGLWIVDQHVAHERILYELFLKDTTEAQGIQQLLVPVPVTLTPHRFGLVERFHDNLSRLGFLLEPFGGGTYIVRGVPVAFGGKRDAAFLTTLLEEMLDACVANGRWDAHEAAAALSCRAAIKAGQKLTPEQMRTLVSQLADADNPFACPHGRPIVIELSRHDLERRFGRR